MKVVCIKKDDWVDQFGIPTDSAAPKYNEVCEVLCYFDGCYTLKGYFYEYFTYNFRKIQPALTNAVTRKLVKDFVEVKEKVEPQKQIA